METRKARITSGGIRGGRRTSERSFKGHLPVPRSTPAGIARLADVRLVATQALHFGSGQMPGAGPARREPRSAGWWQARPLISSRAKGATGMTPTVTNRRTEASP